jgi:porin
MAGLYKLGGWYAATSFPDVQFGLTATGVPVTLVSPSSVSALDHQGNWRIYGIADQMVWRARQGRRA